MLCRWWPANAPPPPGGAGMARRATAPHGEESRVERVFLTTDGLQANVCAWWKIPRRSSFNTCHGWHSARWLHEFGWESSPCSTCTSHQAVALVARPSRHSHVCLPRRPRDCVSRARTVVLLLASARDQGALRLGAYASHHGAHERAQLRYGVARRTATVPYAARR